MEEGAGCPRAWVPPDLERIGHGYNGSQGPHQGVAAMIFRYGSISPQANAAPLPRAPAFVKAVKEEGRDRAGWE